MLFIRMPVMRTEQKGCREIHVFDVYTSDLRRADPGDGAFGGSCDDRKDVCQLFLRRAGRRNYRLFSDPIFGKIFAKSHVDNAALIINIIQ